MVLDDLTGHKATTRRFLEEDQLGDRVHECGDLCTADYIEHDPAMPQESIGLAEARQAYRELAEVFELRHSVDGMAAEADLVTARGSRCADGTSANTRQAAPSLHDQIPSRT